MKSVMMSAVALCLLASQATAFEAEVIQNSITFEEEQLISRAAVLEIEGNGPVTAVLKCPEGSLDRFVLTAPDSLEERVFDARVTLLREGETVTLEASPGKMHILFCQYPPEESTE